MHKKMVFSLGPRPFAPPIFDHLQYATMEGETLGDLVMCSDVGWTEGGHMGGVAQQRVLKSFWCSHSEGWRWEASVFVRLYQYCSST